MPTTTISPGTRLGPYEIQPGRDTPRPSRPRRGTGSGARLRDSRSHRWLERGRKGALRVHARRASREGVPHRPGDGRTEAVEGAVAVGSNRRRGANRGTHVARRAVLRLQLRATAE